MKNLALTLAMVVVVAACSSGSTVAPLPSTVTSQFSGTFKNQNNTQSGNIRLDISEDDAGAINGNMIIESTGVRCLSNGQVSGSSNGFNVSLTSTQSRTRFRVTTTTTRVTGTDDMGAPVTSTSTSVRLQDNRQEPSSRDDGRGNTTTVEVEEVSISGNVNIQLAIGDNGNSLSGTYTTSDDLCSNSTGAGDMTLTRI